MITRRNITKIPITKEIVKQVDCIARQEKMSTGLKILTDNNTTLYDTTLLAGVEDDNKDTETESISEQESTQTDKDEKYEHKQDIMDPNNIKELNQSEVMEEEIIFPEEETDDQLQYEQESDQETDNPEDHEGVV